jgi:hypothetical protein
VISLTVTAGSNTSRYGAPIVTGGGLWYVRRSTTGTDLVQGFGGPGDDPVVPK